MTVWWVDFWRTAFHEGCLLQLAVVCNCSLCINHHSKGHQQRSRRAAKSRCTFAMCTASWYLCMLLARSGCLIASSNNVRYSLCIFHPTSVTKNVGAHIYLGRENAVHEKPWLTGSKVCEPVHLVVHKPIEMAICALLASDESKNVFFVLPAPLSSENTDLMGLITWLVERSTS